MDVTDGDLEQNQGNNSPSKTAAGAGVVKRERDGNRCMTRPHAGPPPNRPSRAAAGVVE